MKTLILFFVLSISHTFAQPYPEDWFKPVSREGAPTWEILPQDAAPGEVILSKRTELGILSNFAPTPFTFRGKAYASVEGFWQMMKYPDSELENDIRSTIKFPFVRTEVSQMTAFEAKNAGSAASKIMKELNVDWVSFEGVQMLYCSIEAGTHYQLIKEAMIEKLRQNPEVRRILLATGDLILRPDHLDESCKAPEWKYYEIWMELRSQLQE